MKNSQSKLSTTLTQYYNSRHRLILTGTPLQNNLPELWSLLNFVLPKVFNSVKSFDDWFNTPFANTGGQDKIELNEEEQLLVIRRLHKVLRPFLLRRLKKDVESELPDKVERVIKCKMSALQTKLTNMLKTHKVIFSDEGSAAGERKGVKGLQNIIMQLKKLCNHPFAFEQVETEVNGPARPTNNSLWRTAGKFELLDRVLPKLFATKHRVRRDFHFSWRLLANLLTPELRLGLDLLPDDPDHGHLPGLLRLSRDQEPSPRRHDQARRACRPPQDLQPSRLRHRPLPAVDPRRWSRAQSADGRHGGHLRFGLEPSSGSSGSRSRTSYRTEEGGPGAPSHHVQGAVSPAFASRYGTDPSILQSVEEHIMSKAQFKLDMDKKVIQAGRFDNKSSAEERETFLRELLEVDVDDDDDDNELGASACLFGDALQG